MSPFIREFQHFCLPSRTYNGPVLCVKCVHHFNIYFNCKAEMLCIIPRCVFTQIINVFSMSTISGHLSAGDGLLNFYVPGHPNHQEGLTFCGTLKAFRTTLTANGLLYHVITFTVHHIYSNISRLVLISSITIGLDSFDRLIS